MKRHVARGTLLGVAGQGWHLVTALVLYAYLARQFGPGLFGEWRVVLSVLAWLEVFVTAGLVRVATKAISETPDDEAVVASATYAGQIAVGVALFLVVQVVAAPIARLLSNESLAVFLRVSALDIPLYAVFMAASSVALGTRRFERQAVAWFIYATSKAVLIGAAVVLGFSVTGALVGNALSSLVGFAAVFVSSRGRGIDLALIRHRLSSMMRPAIPFLTIGLVEGVELNADLWLVSAIVVNGVLVGLYASAAALAEIPVFLFLGLNRVIFPAFANARAQGDLQTASDYARQAVRLALIVTMLGIALVIGAGRQVLELVYSAQYAAAFIPLVLLILAGSGRTIRGVCTEILLAENRRGPVFGLLVGNVVLEIVLVSVLAMRFGLVGAAAGAAAGGTIAAIAGSVLIRDLIGLRPLATLARSTVAGVVVGAALIALSPTPLLAPVALVVAGIVYGVILAVLGEFSAEDIASLKASLGRTGARTAKGDSSA